MVTLKSTSYGLLFLLMHKFYVSTVQMNYNTERNKLEVILQVFTDDLELAIREEVTADFKIDAIVERGTVFPELKTYVNTHWRLMSNDEQLPLEFIGYESDYDITKVYFEIDLAPANEALLFSNTIFLQQFSDQKNLTHIKIGGERKSFLLNATKVEFKLDYPIKF